MGNGNIGCSAYRMINCFVFTVDIVSECFFLQTNLYQCKTDRLQPFISTLMRVFSLPGRKLNEENYIMPGIIKAQYDFILTIRLYFVSVFC